MTSDRPGGQPGMSWPSATEAHANAVAFKAAAVADADPGQDRDFPPAQSRTRRFAPARRSTSPRAQADRRSAGMTLTTIPQRRPRPGLHSGKPRHPAGHPGNDERQHARIPARGVSRRLTRLSLPGRTSSRCLVSTRLRGRGRDRHHVPADSLAPLRTREDVGGPGRRDTADDPRRDARLPAEEARSPQAVPEASFLLHTQEELAPRNLLDNTVRCLMPFLARGHHSPDEGGEDGGSAPAGSGVSSGSRS